MEKKRQILEKYAKIEKIRQENEELRQEEVNNKKVHGEIRENKVKENLASQSMQISKDKRNFITNLEFSIEKVFFFFI